MSMDYINRLPEKYRSFVTIVGPPMGIKTSVLYQNPCGHSSTTEIGSLLQRKQFDNCLKCNQSKKYLDTIPETYRKYISGEISDFDSLVTYTNPGCGHITTSTIGSLSRRKQFDYCSKCPKKKTSAEYINSLPKEISSHIISVGEDYGRFTLVKIKYPCGCINELKIHALIQNGIKSCRCTPKNQLSKDNMIDGLSPYVYDPKVIDGFPGSRTSKIKAVCKKCNSEIKFKYFNAQQYYKYHQSGCPYCNTDNEAQNKIQSFIESLNVEYEVNNRNIIKYESNKHKELDFYCADANFAIEYNGLLWHSEKYKADGQYHWKKTKSCLDKGITLLHIWSDKYHNNHEIYNSIIKIKLGMGIRIFARKTQCKEIVKSQAKAFLDSNHLDGSTGCLSAWGLFLGDELLEVISVRKVNAQNKKYKNYLEIARLATKKNYVVVGGESKLLSCVETYAKKHKFLGILNYVSCDFGGSPKSRWKYTYQGITDISYFYTDGVRRISRQKLQRRKPGQTERDLQKELKLYKVFGTPNLIYTYTFEENDNYSF